MRATPDRHGRPGLPAVMDAGGRLLPFDRSRLTVALTRAFAPDADAAERARDVVAALEAWLARPEQGPVVAAEELSRLARRVLSGLGDERAAMRLGRRAPGGRPSRPDPLTIYAAQSGPASGERLTRALLAEHLLDRVLSGDVSRAESSGVLSLGAHVDGTRAVSAALPAAAMPALLAPRAGPSPADVDDPRSLGRLARRLRPLLERVTRELVVPWSGAPPVAGALATLDRALGPAAGRLVLALPAIHGAAAVRSLAASAPAGGVRLRLLGDDARGERPRPDGPWPTGRLEWAPSLPAPGVVRALCGLDLAASARGLDPGDAAAFLSRVERSARLARSACDGLAGLALDRESASSLADACGRGERHELRLAGVRRAVDALLGRRAGHLSDDLLAAVGQRLARGLAPGDGGLPVALSLDLRGVPLPRLVHRRRLLGIDAGAAVPAELLGDPSRPTSPENGCRPCA